MNLLQIAFGLIAILVVFLGVIVNWFEKIAPDVILTIYRYGKFSHRGSAPFTVQVPKRWFRHFYVVSSILTFTIFAIMLSLYFKLIKDIPPFISVFLNFVGAPSETVPASKSFLAITLLMVQCFKRFYETHFVSVFSESKMDIGHYILGHFHYFGAALGIFAESSRSFSGSHIGLMHIVSSIVFLWACKNQFECAKILANLRKNGEGKVLHTKHQIPKGSYFELVSSPHLFFEIIMYLSLWIILWENTTWPYIVLWVVSNQIETSFLTHWWYKETFKSYPKQRKSIIPYLL